MLACTTESAECMRDATSIYSVNYAGGRARGSFFKSTKSERENSGENVSRTMGDKRRFEGQARALCKLFSYPFSVNPRAVRPVKRKLSHRFALSLSLFLFFQLLHFSVNDVRDRIQRVSLAWISNICIERENKHEWLSRSVNAVILLVFEI